VPGECEDRCGASEACFTLVDEGGNPIPITPGGPSLGVCSVPPVGTQGAYDECGGAAGACEAGLSCLDLLGIDAAPFCAPSCSSQNTNCPSREGIQGACALGATAGNPTNCALLCPAANDGTSQGCPAGMTCTAVNATNGLCVWPE
jgi:hypothetical protein